METMAVGLMKGRCKEGGKTEVWKGRREHEENVGTESIERKHGGMKRRWKQWQLG